MPRPDQIVDQYTDTQKEILNGLIESVRYKIVDEEGNMKFRSAQWPHDYTMRKGWKIIDTQKP